jgi:putative acetyltransferase
MNALVTVREFAPGDEAAFRDLNLEWISRYFAVEPKDAATLSDPHSTILADGGKIFIAVAGDRPVGCCALVATAPGEFEVAKMAVTAACQGMGVGRLLLETTIQGARASGATRLFLETNHTLTPALRLYASVGFRHIPPERVEPSPYVRADVHMELLLAGE